MKAQLRIVTLPVRVAFAQSPVPPQPTPAAQDSKVYSARHPRQPGTTPHFWR